MDPDGCVLREVRPEPASSFPSRSSLARLLRDFGTQAAVTTHQFRYSLPLTAPYPLPSHRLLAAEIVSATCRSFIHSFSSASGAFLAAPCPRPAASLPIWPIEGTYSLHYLERHYLPLLELIALSDETACFSAVSKLCCAHTSELGPQESVIISRIDLHI